MSHSPIEWYDENQYFWFEGKRITVNASSSGSLTVRDGHTIGQFVLDNPHTYQ